MNETDGALRFGGMLGRGGIPPTPQYEKILLGISQEKLACLADVSNNTVVNIEAGKQNNPTIETLKKVANTLQVGVNDLIK